MSQENVEIVCRLYEAWNQGDFDAGWELCDADLVADRSNSLGPDARIYRRRAEVEQFFNQWRASWAATRWEIERYIDGGDKVVVSGRLHVRGVESGATVEANVNQVATLRDGKIVHIKLFQTPDEALTAAGLRE